MTERIVLVGFMGAGKSTVGRLLADRLGWDFVDLDAEIERRSGRTVEALFAEGGEPRFRELETRATLALAGRRRLVLAPGGGWALRHDPAQALGADTLVVWLRVAPEEALRRLEGGPPRPLLAGDEPLRRARALLEQREPVYARSHAVVDTDGRPPAAVVEEILALRNG